MIRVATIGNSHLGALANGWQSTPELHEELELTFFGAPGEQLRSLAVGEDHLYATALDTERHIARSSQGLTTIDADAYDAFLLVGGLGFAVVTDIYLTHRLPADATAHHDLISEPALEASMRDVLLATVTPCLVKQLQAITDAPVLMVTDPLPNSRIASLARHRRRWTGEHLANLHAHYERTLADLSAELGAAIVTQPPETIEPPCFTRPELAMDHPKSGITHTGSTFGAEVLRDAAPRLRQMLEVTAASR